MNRAVASIRTWYERVWDGWNGFWFTPAPPQTLAMLRILAGLMLFYTHLVWSLDLMAFLGPHSWVSLETIRDMHRESYAWSYLWHVSSPWPLWLLHIAALVVFALFTLGLFTRVTSILAAVITISYCHRLTGSLFGLDQINAMLALYLAVGPAGAVYSLDHWLKTRRDPRDGKGNRFRHDGEGEGTSVSANLAIRLIQVHLCVIYLFGGIGKMRGEMWWDGSALWFAVANLEYQSLDVTWLVRYPWLVAMLTHITVFWETFYAVLVWPRLTRPLMLATAVFVHLGIAVFLGMPTFGLAMLIANAAFIPPELVGGWIARLRIGSPRLATPSATAG